MAGSVSRRSAIHYVRLAFEIDLSSEMKSCRTNLSARHNQELLPFSRVTRAAAKATLHVVDELMHVIIDFEVYDVIQESRY
jgi:hypothetical protein